MRFWLGGYGADMKGTGSGIGVLHVGGAAEQTARGGLAFAGTAAEVASPSWLASHPTLPVIYAALEGLGSVQAFVRTGAETLQALGEPVFTGAFTCHLAVSPDGTLIVATGYGDGNVAFVSVAADGRLGEAFFGAPPVDPYAGVARVDDPELSALSASGFTVASAPTAAPVDDEVAAAANALRDAVGAEFAGLIPGAVDDDLAQFLASQDPALRDQLLANDASLSQEIAARIVADSPEAVEPAAVQETATDVRVPHAHQARFLADSWIATTDLGFDLVRFWRRGERGFDDVQQVVLPQGSGPRHTVWHPSGHLHVVTEYSCEVFTLGLDAGGRWRLLAATLVAGEVSVGVDFPGELSMSRSGEHLYAGVRGQNTIATLAVKDNGARVIPVAAVDAHVNWPRHHVLVGDRLFVAGQRSETVVSLSIDERTQVPSGRTSSVSVPTPSVLLPIFD